MIWVILGICILAIAIAKWENTDGLSMLLIFVVAPLLLIPILTGISTYPYLVSTRVEVVSLQEEIITVKEAHYSEVGSGALVGGSLDNMQQSKELTIFIKGYVEKKAKYNGALEATKIKREILMYKLFSNALFISNRIHGLERIDRQVGVR